MEKSLVTPEMLVVSNLIILVLGFVLGTWLNHASHKAKIEEMERQGALNKHEWGKVQYGYGFSAGQVFGQSREYCSSCGQEVPGAFKAPSAAQGGPT